MFTRILDVLDKILTFFEEWTLYLAVMVGLMSLFINVVLRYGFNYSLAWSEELIREIIIYTTFIGLSPAIKNGSLITIDALVQLVPRFRRALTFFSHLSVMIFSVLIFKLGIEMAEMQAATFQKTIILELPLVFLYLVLPLMGFTMFVRTVQVMWRDYNEAKAQKQAA